MSTKRLETRLAPTTFAFVVTVSQAMTENITARVREASFSQCHREHCGPDLVRRAPIRAGKPLRIHEVECKLNSFLHLVTKSFYETNSKRGLTKRGRGPAEGFAGS